MGRLDGKVGIVTGAASGIGRAIALALANEGARVTAADVNLDGLKATARAASGTIRVQGCDVSRADDVRSLVDETVSAFGGLHVLCNNAGISIPNRVTDLSEEDWDRTLAVNLKGVFSAASMESRQCYVRVAARSSIPVPSIRWSPSPTFRHTAPQRVGC